MKFLRNIHAAVAELNERNTNKPPMLVETRWNSRTDILSYFVENWMGIICVVAKFLPRNGKMLRYMKDITLEQGAQDLLETLNPFSQKDETCLPYRVRIWKELLDKSPATYFENIVKRRNEALTGSLVDLLDHRGKTQLVNAPKPESVFNYINEVNP